MLLAHRKTFQTQHRKKKLDLRGNSIMHTAALEEEEEGQDEEDPADTAKAITIEHSERKRIPRVNSANQHSAPVPDEEQKRIPNSRIRLRGGRTTLLKLDGGGSRRRSRIGIGGSAAGSNGRDSSAGAQNSGIRQKRKLIPRDRREEIRTTPQTVKAARFKEKLCELKSRAEHSASAKEPEPSAPSSTKVIPKR